MPLQDFVLICDVPHPVNVRLLDRFVCLLRDKSFENCVEVESKREVSANKLLLLTSLRPFKKGLLEDVSPV